jgi:predicted dehydrogenase
MAGSTHSATRREFMKHSGAAVAGVALAAAATRKARAQEDVIRVGLIGCGGRGSGAARQALNADPQARLVALGDTFSDRLEGCLKSLSDSDMAAKVTVDDGHKFTGFDAYKKVIEASDVVLLCEPPAFRPASLRAAVEAGKHVFCEKPVAVDAPGVRHVMETCKLAKQKSVNVVSGLCYRYQFAKQDTIKRIQDGAVGDIVTLQTTYNTGGLWHHGRDEKWSEMEYQVRNWLYWTWLSGDHINEQHIHSLDKIAWAMGDEYPVKCTSSGGRAVRTDPKYGNIYDHFNTTYEWASGVRCFSSCRQWANAAATDVSDHVYGTKGVAHIQEHHIVPAGGAEWRYATEGPDDMYQNEHNALFAAIRNGDAINNGAYMCNSTLMAIMARMSAYTGQEIAWEQALNSQLDLSPEKLAWGDAPQRPIARPGETEFV